MRTFLTSCGTLWLVFASIASAQVPSVGLSTVRSQSFGNENLLGFYVPDAGDQFGYAVATGDFNGDGADDLATAMPFDDGLADSPVVDSGSVVVRFGSPGLGGPGVGLASDLASAVLRQVPYMNPPEAGDGFGGSLASCDFNGDGFDDLAIGVPGENHVGRVHAGAVQVHYGSSVLGINFNPEGFFVQSSPGIPGDAEDGDLWGRSLACGDFDGDSFDDLVVGAPDEMLGSLIVEPQAGMAVIIPGSTFGLNAQASTYLTQDVDGVGGDAETSDRFSWAMAAGDFNGDGADDLAVSSPGEDGKGAIHAFFGGPSGINPSGGVFWMETFVGGSSESGDFFGGALASADFNGDGFDDLAVGIPGDDLGLNEAELDAGRVAILFGGRPGLAPSGTQFFTEFEILGPANSEIGDRFGEVLAAGDFDKDGFADLAIGHPGESLSTPKSGEVTILMGSATGLTDARTREIAPGIEGFPGDATQSDRRFSHALASGDFDGDGHADLALGTPYESVDGKVDVGSETVLYGALFADGVDNGDLSFWSSAQSSSVGNRVAATKEARLGPSSAGKFGLEFLVADGVPRGMPAPSFVRADPDRGFNNERALSGSFFIDPQNLTMSNAAGQNVFQFMAFDDGVGPGSRNRLAFDLVRVGTFYAIVANFHNEAINGLQAAGAAQLATAGDPLGHNLKIDFEWRAGTPGHLTVWLTRFPADKVQIISADLPDTGNSVINRVTAGVVVGQDPGTFGRLFLDEVSFRR